MDLKQAANLGPSALAQIQADYRCLVKRNERGIRDHDQYLARRNEKAFACFQDIVGIEQDGRMDRSAA